MIYFLFAKIVKVHVKKVKLVLMMPHMSSGRQATQELISTAGCCVHVVHTICKGLKMTCVLNVKHACTPG